MRERGTPLPEPKQITLAIFGAIEVPGCAGGSRVLLRQAAALLRSPEKKRKHSLHARASTAIDGSRLIGRYCLKGFQRPHQTVPQQTHSQPRERKTPTALPKTKTQPSAHSRNVRQKKGESKHGEVPRSSALAPTTWGDRANERGTSEMGCALVVMDGGVSHRAVKCPAK